MKTLYIILSVLVFPFSTIAQTVNYEANPDLSEVKWSAAKVSGNHFGTVTVKSGKIEVKNDKLVNAEVLIDMTSIVVTDIEDKSTNAALKGHLDSDDFFGTNKYPQAGITITQVIPESDGTYTAKGSITIKGQTQDISFPFVYKIEKGTLVAIAELKIDRTKFGIRYGSGNFFENLGDNMIYDEFEVKVKLVARPEPKAGL